VHRLSAGSGRSPLEFAFLLPSDKGDGIRMGADDQDYELCLGKQDLGEQGNGCIFLAPPDEGLRCTVHAHRPMVCRSFPMRPQVDGTWLPQGDPCPKGIFGAHHVDQALATKLNDAWETERRLGVAFVEGWNKIAVLAPAGKSRSPRMFFYWLMAYFDRVQTAGPPGADALMIGALKQALSRVN